MINGVGIQPIGLDKQTAGIGGAQKESGMSFGDFLSSAINKVNDLQQESENLNNLFAAGKIDNIQQVMIASEKAEMAMQFTLQIRNKLLDAYTEIMRMQV